MDPLPHASPWDAFPLILCINLKERDDRFAEAQAEFQRVGLRHVTFYRTTRQSDRNKGCIDSHMACLQHAVNLNVPYALILEDDVQFLDPLEEHLHRVLHFIRTQPHWNLFYLGGFIFRKTQRFSQHILRGGVLCTQAYVINTRFAKTLLQQRPLFQSRLVSVDLFYSMMIWNHAFIHDNPLLCIQRASESDGTWDSRNVSKAGWLGKAMLYSALDSQRRKESNLFPSLEKFKVENGLMFFIAYRTFLYSLVHTSHACRKLLRKPHPLPQPHPGEFVTLHPYAT